MRKKHAFISVAATYAFLMCSSIIQTDVFAGTIGITKGEMITESEGYLDDQFSTVEFGNNDVGFGVFSTVAKKVNVYNASQGRYYYDVEDFPLTYRMYFNNYKEGTSGEQHAPLVGELAYKIEPSGSTGGSGSTDATNWFFPDLANWSTMTTRQKNNFLSNFQTEYGSEDLLLDNDGNINGLDDAEKGIFTVSQYTLFDNDIDRGYKIDFDIDAKGHAYYTMNLYISNLVGKPGDKLTVTAFHAYQPYVARPHETTFILKGWPKHANTPGDRVPTYDGLKIVSGYIYIPYELTFDINKDAGATGTAPVMPDDEYLTCDHNSVTLPTQGNMSNGDSRLLGWSETKVNGTIDASEAPSDLKAPGSSFAINKDMKLYAVWGTPASEATPSLSKRVLQSGSTLIPDMSFTFKFEQLNEWDGVNYVSTAAPIANQTVTVNSSSPRLNTDSFVGDLTGKTLYEGKIDNVLNGYRPTVAGTYAYKVSEVIPDPKAEGVSYTNSEFIMLVEVEDTPSGLKPVTVTNILYKDSQGNTKDQYTTPPAVFDEKHELIFYNNYGTDGGTTPTGIITNNLPFIVIIAGGVGGAVAATVIKAKKRARR